jgi:dCTP deaminase
MAVLGDTALREALANGALIISPRPAPECISTSAIDLTLGRAFLRWKSPPGGMEFIVDPASEAFRFPNVASQLLEPAPTDEDGSVVLKPNQFILANTAEKVQLPLTGRLAARVEGRSTLARFGIGVHVTAPTIHADFRGVITLEITNTGVLPVRLRPGLRICQLVVERVSGDPGEPMEGVFQDQRSPRGADS